MLVRRYLVSAMPEALQLIRKELGKDAVILSSKKVRRGGWMGLFMKEKIEVIAAMTSPAEASRRTNVVSSAERRNTTVADRATVLAGWESVSDTGHLSNRPLPPKIEDENLNNGHQVISTIAEPSLPVDKVTEVQVLGEPQPRSEVAEPIVEGMDVESSALMKEVREMKQMIRHLREAALPVDEVLIPLHQRLIEQLVDEHHRESILSYAESIRQTGLPLGQSFHTQLIDQMAAHLSNRRDGCYIANDTRIAAFVGPTGVGKTTTIAKLAADLILKQGKRPAMITTDTYRIAAVDQLRTYATILGIPLEVVFSPNDIQSVLGRFEDRDVILVDTAGRNYRDRTMVESLTRMLESLAPDETLLTLSMTTKEADQRQVVNNFLPLGVDKFLFTKLDETDVMGQAYNLLAEYQLPVAYFTTGQNVPDDFELASIERLCTMIVGETLYDGSS